MNTAVLPKTVTLYKPLGWTPLETVRTFQRDHPQYASVKLGYAGRLDPMAEGLLLILVGEENKKKKQYEQLPKKYVFEMLFGIATDSYDILGLITNSAPPPPLSVLKKKIPQIKKRFTGTISQQYPPYASKPVKGKPLYWWARNNRLSDITIPSEMRTISSLELHRMYSLTAEALRHTIEQRISLVKGKFRQKEILLSWKWYFENHSDDVFPTLRFHAAVSSGTYIRSLCHDIGTFLKIPTLAFRIVRTKIGIYTIESDRELSLSSRVSSGLRR